ncbi:hypothetical protein ACH5RR_038470 [Cinchona calisaya]|uniref:Uncharacterized protein n=1 Tax=Cinchona calisaya TaxID=153742 RepID=A0ABD2XVD3_9GENT
MPARSSKRLSGQKPEILPELGLSERALRAAVRKPCQTEAYISSNLAQNSAANGVPQQYDTQPQREDQVAQEQAVVQVNEKREAENPRSQDSQFWYFGESFSDPRYEFAFKTLTGEIPFEDALAFPAASSNKLRHHLLRVMPTCFGPSEVDSPVLFQNDRPFHFDLMQQNISTDQVPPKSTIPPGNVNLPSCSSFGSQQPSLEARSKDYETKVNS